MNNKITDYNLIMSNKILDDFVSHKNEIILFNKFLRKNNSIEIMFVKTKVPKNLSGSFKTFMCIEMLGKDNLEKITLLHTENLDENEIIIYARRIITMLILLDKEVFVGHSSSPFYFNVGENSDV